MAPSGIITLLTDFGLEGPYVGAMKGVVLSIHPEATIVDITHDIPPGDVRQAAFVLASAVRTFPPGTIHAAVVDPGVGSDRRAIALEAEGSVFLAPDNGLLSYFLTSPSVPDATRVVPQPHFLAPGQRLVHLQEERFWRNPVSRTFHGRDIFAPVAAHLCAGVLLEELGPASDHLLAFPIPQAVRTGEGALVGEVLAVDRFGNLITCIREQDLPGGRIVVEVAGRTIAGLSNSYAQAQGLLAIIGSGGYLEIALRDGSAAAELGVGVGAPIILQPG